MEDAETLNTDFNNSMYPSVGNEKSTDFQASERPLSHEISFAQHFHSTYRTPRTREITPRDMVSEISEPSPYQIVQPTQTNMPPNVKPLPLDFFSKNRDKIVRSKQYYLQTPKV